MAEFDYEARMAMIARRNEKLKSIHKKWVDIPSGMRAIVSDLAIVLQLGLLAFLYAFFAYKYPIFFYISIALTVGAAVQVFICERDAQSKASWLLLFMLSFGCGYIVYFLADKRICYGYDKKRYEEIFARSRPFIGGISTDDRTRVVKNDCEYMLNYGGYAAYTGTDIKYFSDARSLFDNLLMRLEEAEEFIFLEYFIVADGVLMERLLNVLRRKVAQGVEVRFLYDDCGSQGVLCAETKKRMRDAGVDFKVFARLFTLFSFSLNYRDHRKIVVIDGKTGYVGGCNIADECTNEKRMVGIWKDAGVRLDGPAVDGLSLTFLRQWELSQRVRSDFGKYVGRAEKTSNSSVVVPYAGGPELDEPLCRGVYANLISNAREKLYIMTPYLIPDGDLFSRLAAKAKSGVDVRLVLPSMPDYPFIYAVTRSNAEKLMKCGVKVYYVHKTFVHSKVMLTENCVAVGSVNLDMRAFYIEFDNGVYTDDKKLMEDVAADFAGVFATNGEQVPAHHNIFSRAVTAILRVVSPLM